MGAAAPAGQLCRRGPRVAPTDVELLGLPEFKGIKDHVVAAEMAAAQVRARAPTHAAEPTHGLPHHPDAAV